MALVGSFVGIEASPIRIVYTAQKSTPNDAATTIGPMDEESALGRKFSGTSRRARKPTASASASSNGG
jgi:hypothetical protein